MASGLAITFDLLRATENQSATAALIAGLEASQHDLRDRSLAALLARHESAAELEILRRWPTLSERWKAQVAERPGWLSEAIHTAIHIRDAALYSAACLAAVETRDVDQIPLLVVAAEDASNRQARLAATTVLELAEILAESLAAPRDYRQRSDPRLQRQHVLACLERAASEFTRHGCRELLEAFVLLANRENAVLKRSLQSPGDRSYRPLTEVLGHSTRPAVIRLLLSYLDDPHAPLAALQLLAHRSDISFVRQLVRRIGCEPGPVVCANLKRIESIAWLNDDFQMLDAFRDADQAGAVMLAVASGLPRSRALETVAYLLRNGKAAGRRAAARTLSEFAGPAADQLAIRALDDDDPLVRAAVAEQLRSRSVPGAVSLLIELLDSRHEAERAAAEACLAEFRFPRYLAAFDSLTPEARTTTGMLVKRIDPQAVDLVRQELTATARGRRKRGLALAVAMAAIDEVRDSIAALLSDEDPFLRIDTIRVLAGDDSPQALSALRQTLLDPHPLVREAGEAALRRSTEGTNLAGTATHLLSDTTPLSAIVPGLNNPAAPRAAVTAEA